MSGGPCKGCDTITVVPNSQVSPSPLQEALDRIGEEGVATERERRLLWLIRNRFGVGTADSYEYVFAEGFSLFGVTVDAALVSEDRDALVVVYILEGDSASELHTRVKNLSAEFSEHDAAEKELARTSFQLRSILQLVLSTDAAEIVRLVLCVATASLKPAEQNRIVNSSNGSVSVEVVDAKHLEALARALETGDRRVPDVRVSVAKSNVLSVPVGDQNGIVFPVRATEIAQWPGIQDRTLFDLNVRHALGINRVRKSLDKALTDPESATEFIAYHNGITAVCDSFVVDDEEIRIEGLSVVNGAQSVVAIHANESNLDSRVRLLMKLIEAPRESELARSIAIRSNTQNPVTSRNLRALDDVQSRISQELAQFGYFYSVRPDQESPAGPMVIRNDDAAQLLCSMYVQKPWLAVKRQLLFEAPLYGEIFPTDLDPARIVFAHLTRQAIQDAHPDVPERYRKAWALTALTLFYMTAEAIRSDPHFSKKLEDPQEAIRQPENLRAQLSDYVDAACSVLVHRAQKADQESQEGDDFRVAFKHSRTLTELAAQTAKAWKHS